ncbi:MAG: glycosyltransferase family 1 protein [Gallionella sp.]|nr:glycosyltransferase family 1 protein [Gallionella sp.]
MTDNLRVGLYLPPDIPQSFKVYADNVAQHFPALGVEIVPFGNRNELPRTADVLWDIRSGGGNPPLEFLLGGPPLVITVHGFAPISLSGWEYFRTLRGMLMTGRYAREKLAKWQELKGGVAHLIAVSHFTKHEAVQLTGVPADKITVCHHGVDTASFTPDSGTPHENYFLHISNNEPRKNLPRVVAAFKQLRKHHDVRLLLKLPAQQAECYRNIDGVEVIANMLSTAQLAALYQRALGFVFPSLYEGFGLPILEAMASGCPVITSNASACPEVAGNAALIADPRDQDAIFGAMRTLLLDPFAREQLVSAGLKHCGNFTWQASAACHASVLRNASN